MWEHLPLGLEGEMQDNPSTLEILQACSILCVCVSLICSLLFSDSRPVSREGGRKPFSVRGGVLGGDIWAQGKPKERRSPVWPLRWPRSRGCNVPELPVESALDQVHSQAGASEAPASGRARWPRARWVPHGRDTERSFQPFGDCGSLRSQGTPAPSSLHSSPQQLPSPGQPPVLPHPVGPHSPATAAPLRGENGEGGSSRAFPGTPQERPVGMREVGSMQEVGWRLFLRSYLIIKRLLFPRSKGP